jgi:hypothetical protein
MFFKQRGCHKSSQIFFLIPSECADFSQAEYFRENPSNPSRTKSYPWLILFLTADVLQTARMSLIFADFFLIPSEYADFSQAGYFLVNPFNLLRAKSYL